MTRRQIIGASLVVLLIGLNVLVWILLNQPAERPYDNREMLRKQLTAEWQRMETCSFDEVPGVVEQAVEAERAFTTFVEGKDEQEIIYLRIISEEEEADLHEAISEAVLALAANEPLEIIRYMKSRGLKPNTDRMAQFIIQMGGEDHPNLKSAPSKQFSTLWELSKVDLHWEALVPKATKVRVWQPRTLRSVSNVQLGQNESWLWGKDIISQSLFVSAPDFFQASISKPAKLADVRVLIQYDESLDQVRSPCFIRFWYSEKQSKWQPHVLKLVWTEMDENKNPPIILF